MTLRAKKQYLEAVPVPDDTSVRESGKNSSGWAESEWDEGDFPSQYARNIGKKQETEELLLSIAANNPGISVDTAKIKNTSVFQNSKRVLNIFYRKDKVRADVPLNEVQYSLAKELVQSGLASEQNKSRKADPYATSGWYAVFIEQENEQKAYEILLLTKEKGK